MVDVVTIGALQTSIEYRPLYFKTWIIPILIETQHFANLHRVDQVALPAF